MDPQDPYDQPVRRRQPQQDPQQAWGQPTQPGYGPPAGYPVQPPGPGPAPKKKGSKLGLGCLGVVVLFIAIAVGAAIANPKTAGTTGPAAGATAGTGAPAAGGVPGTTPAAAAAPVKTVVLQQSGSGGLGTKSFTVGDNWSLAYTFDCSSFGQSGNFQVYEDYPNGNVLVNELAKTGSNVTYQHGDAGKHSLEVNSECKWTITATDGDG